jgi:hypothetical protein
MKDAGCFTISLSVSPANNIKVIQNPLACGAFAEISIEGGGEPNQPPKAICVFPSTCIRARPERIGSRG